MKLAFFPIFILFGCIANASELSDLANSMQPGQWEVLNTSGIAETVGGTGGNTGIAYVFAHQHGGWFPQQRKLAIVGGDHNGGGQRLMMYDENSNSWSQGPTPPSGGAQFHAHGYNAFDAQSGFLYYMLTGNIFSVNSNSWVGTATRQSGLGRANSGFAFFDGVGLVEAGAGGLWLSRDQGSSWNTLGEYRTYAFGGSGDLAPFCIYNPTKNVVWFGGGDGENNNFTMNSNNTVTQQADPPLPELTGNRGGAPDGIKNHISYDPASGDFLVLNAEHSTPGDPTPPSFYSFDLNQWEQLPQPPFTENINSIVSFPVSTYGVVVFLEYSASTSRMHVYKHGNGTPIPPTPAPDAPTELQVN